MQAIATTPDLRLEDLWVNQVKKDSAFPDRINVNFRVANYGAATQTTFGTTVVIPGVSNDLIVVQSRDGKPSIDAATVDGSGQVVPAVIFMHKNIRAPAGSFTVTVTVDSSGNLGKSVAGSVTTDVSNPPVGQWFELGPRNVPGEGAGAVGKLYQVVVAPLGTTRIMVMGENPADGLWGTTDGGASWSQLTGSAPLLAGAFNPVAFDPGDGKRIFVAAAAAGFYRSEDFGDSWKKLSSFGNRSGVPGSTFGRLIVDPSNPQRMYSTAQGGVWRTADGGYTWTQIFNNGAPRDLVMIQGSANRVYVSSESATSSVAGVYKTESASNVTTSGWSQLAFSGACGLPDLKGAQLNMAAGIGNVVYLQVGSTVFRSNTTACTAGPAALSFTKTSLDPSKFRQNANSFLRVDPIQVDNVYVGGTDLAISKDGGKTFTMLPYGSGSGHADMHDLAVADHQSNTVFVANDGGLYKSTDGGKTWPTFLSKDVRNFEFHDLAISASQPEVVLGGSQDSGNVRYDGTSTSWVFYDTGDGGQAQIDPTNDQIMYIMGQFSNSLVKQTGAAAGSPQVGVGCGITPVCLASVSSPFRILVDPLAPTALLATCGTSVWRGESIDCSGTPPKSPFKAVATDANGFNAVAVDVLRQLYYAGTGDGRVFMSTAAKVKSGGWAAVKSGASTVFQVPARIVAIDIDPFDPANVIVASGSGGGGRVWQLRIANPAGPAVATDITGDLPALPVGYAGTPLTSVAVNNNRAGLDVFLGTDGAGVYRGSLSAGSWKWAPYNAGMARGVTVSRLLFHPTTGILRVGTFGRGAFEVATMERIGTRLPATVGRIAFLRASVATGIGPVWGNPSNQINAEIIVGLDSTPGWVYGLRMLNDGNLIANRRNLELLRTAFKKNVPVSIEAIRNSLTTGSITRVLLTP